MAKNKTLDGKEIDIDIKTIKSSAVEFTAKGFDDNYPLLKKEEIENTVFTVFKYDQVYDGSGKTYFNIKAINDKDEPFCFNGSAILINQLEENGMPVKVKLIRKERKGDKLKPYYWIFVNPTA